MSLVNDSYDPSSCLKQLQQLVNRVTQSDKSSYTRNQNSGYIQSNDVSASSASCNLPTTLPSQLSNYSSVNGQVLDVYPIPTTSTEFNAQITVHSTSSTSQMQPVTQNLVPPPPPPPPPSPPSETIMNAISTKNQNRQTSLTHTQNKTPIWQAVAHMENLLFQPENPSTNPTWPNCKPTSEVENRKKRVICDCPNCSVQGGNKTYSITGRLQHNCHIPGCGRNFDWPSILQTHLRAHDDDRPFSCTWYSCHKKFKRKGELVRHILVHTDERNFICPRCNLGFKRSDHLNQHIYKVHERSKEKRPAKNRRQK